MNNKAVAIIDYDAGNIKSVQKAVEYLGYETVVTREPKVLLDAGHVILPGVGSFGDAMEHLKHYDLIPVIHDIVKAKKPLMGICLGLQLLFEDSDETPGVEGLGILKGHIRKIPSAPGLKIPHVGWNSLNFPKNSKLFQGIPEESYVYFVHSYYLEAENPDIVAATTEYGVHIHAACEYGNIFACQFHPEKSSAIGLKIIDNFLHVYKKNYSLFRCQGWTSGKRY